MNHASLIEYQITLADSGTCFRCKDGQNVLAAMERLDVATFR